MANLLGHLPSNLEQMKLVQKNLKDASKNASADVDNSDINSMLAEIKRLYKEVKAQEDKFFETFAEGRTGKDAVKYMQDTLAELNQNIGFRSMLNGVDEFDNIIAGASAKGLDLSQKAEIIMSDDSFTRDAFNKYFFDEQGSLKFSKATAEQITEMVNVAIDEQNIKGAQDAEKNGIEFIPTKNIGFRQKTGFGGLIQEINIQVTDQIDENKLPRYKIIATFRDGAALERRFKKRLEDEFDMRFGQENGGDIRGMLKEKLKNLIGVNSSIWPYVEYEFEANAEKFDVNKSTSSLKGFLGEVRANAFLDYMAKSFGTSIPTGNIHMMLDGKQAGEVPIDIFMQGCGWQVKNYEMNSKGEVTFPNQGKQLTTMVDAHFKIQPIVNEIIYEFFGSEAFNTPISGATADYLETYADFKTLRPDAYKIFDIYSLNALKIGKTFQSFEGTLFGDNQEYYNTFFMLNNVPIPASAILEAFYKVLSESFGAESINFQDFIKTSYTITTPAAAKAYREKTNPNGKAGRGEEYIYANYGKDVNSYPSVHTVAETIKASYYITLNAQKIINEIFTTVTEIAK